jgi:hypothetical protein
LAIGVKSAVGLLGALIGDPLTKLIAVEDK